MEFNQAGCQFSVNQHEETARDDLIEYSTPFLICLFCTCR